MAEARLQGKYKITSVVVSSGLVDVHPGKPLPPFTISFKPNCVAGSCGGTWTYFYGSLNGQFHRANHGKFKPYSKGYLAGVTGASLSWCDATGQKPIGAKDSAQFVIKVTDAVESPTGQWVATKIAGTQTEYMGAENGCRASHSKFTFEGRRL